MMPRPQPPIAALTLLLLAACGGGWREPPPESDASFRAAHQVWREQRRQSLTAPGGYLLLVGLHELAEGTTPFGADTALPIVLAGDGIPPSAGSLLREGGIVTLTPDSAARMFRVDSAAGDPPLIGRMALRTDHDSGGPTDVGIGWLRLRVHEVGDRMWLRVWDSNHPLRHSFAGAAEYPPDQGWRLAARLRTYRSPRHVKVADVTGGQQDYTVPGELRFRSGGREYRLLAFAEPNEPKLWVLFGDSTNARETYGGGRYLDVSRPDSSGWTVMDFNRAYNPPCAFNGFATCPLPPRENRLALAVTAGEKRYH